MQIQFWNFLRSKHFNEIFNHIMERYFIEIVIIFYILINVKFTLINLIMYLTFACIDVN